MKQCYQQGCERSDSTGLVRREPLLLGALPDSIWHLDGNRREWFWEKKHSSKLRKLSSILNIGSFLRRFSPLKIICNSWKANLFWKDLHSQNLQLLTVDANNHLINYILTIWKKIAFFNITWNEVTEFSFFQIFPWTLFHLSISGAISSPGAVASEVAVSSP